MYRPRKALCKITAGKCDWDINVGRLQSDVTALWWWTVLFHSHNNYQKWDELITVKIKIPFSKFHLCSLSEAFRSLLQQICTKSLPLGRHQKK